MVRVGFYFQEKCVKWLAAHNTNMNITQANFLLITGQRKTIQQKHEEKSFLERSTSETEYKINKFRDITGRNMLGILPRINPYTSQ